MLFRCKDVLLLSEHTKYSSQDCHHYLRETRS